MAKPDLEQTPPQVILVARRTYAPAEPTHSAVTQFSPDRNVEGQDTPSSPQGKTARGLK